MQSNVIGTFDTATMLQSINATPRPKTFLRERVFGGRQTEFETTYVIAEFMKNKRHMAPFVSRYIAGKTQGKQPFTTSAYTPPRLAPMQSFNGEEAFQRAPGEVIGGSGSPDQRMAAMIARELTAQDWGLTRREEWMIAQMLGTGKIPIVGEGISDEIDLNHTLTDTLAGTAVWGGTTSDPIANLRTWKRDVIKASGLTPDTAILGEDAADALLSDSKVLSMLDNRNSEYGRLTSQNLPNGAEYLGNLVGIDLFAYPEWYVDETTNTEKSMIPEKAAIIFPSAERNPGAEMLYGAYLNVKDGTTYVGARIPREWVEEGPNQRFIQVQSYPLPFVPDVDSWLIATVLL